MAKQPSEESPQVSRMAEGTPEWKPVVVVVPCFNERDRLDLERFVRFSRDHSHIGFLFVDDGSTDGTGDLFRNSTEGDVVRHCRLARNRGKGEAVRHGLNEALEWGPDVVGFWDADLSTPLDELPPMLEILFAKPRLQAVIGSRVQLLGRRMERKATRHYLGRVFATGASLTLGMPVYDTQCGAKIFRVTQAMSSSLQAPFLSRWIFDVELIGRLGNIFGTQPLDWIEEYPLRRWTDIHGSKLRALDFLLAVRDLTRIWWIRRNHGADPLPDDV